MSDRAVVREITALIEDAERGVRRLYPRLYEQTEAEGGATSLTTRRLRAAIARGQAVPDDDPASSAQCGATLAGRGAVPCLSEVPHAAPAGCRFELVDQTDRVHREHDEEDR